MRNSMIVLWKIQRANKLYDSAVEDTSHFILMIKTNVYIL